MGCSCASGVQGLAHFSAYVKDTNVNLTTGRVESVPNATGGMHSRISRAGMGDIFGPSQTNWISGVPNEYVVAGGLLIVLLGVMK